MAKGGEKIKNAFHEVYENKPRTVPASKKGPALRKQLIAIALSKARQGGAKVPKK